MSWITMETLSIVPPKLFRKQLSFQYVVVMIQIFNQHFKRQVSQKIS